MIDLNKVIEKTNSVQTINDNPTELKRDSMRFCLGLFPNDTLEIVDIGHISSYEDLYQEKGIKSIPFNLPDSDMHTFNLPCSAVLVRHVLEHSPAPLLAIMNIFESLSVGGHLVVVVPNSEDTWVEYTPHFTVLTQAGWKKLFKFAGFTLQAEFNRPWRLPLFTEIDNIEYIYLLRKDQP